MLRSVDPKAPSRLYVGSIYFIIYLVFHPTLQFNQLSVACAPPEVNGTVKMISAEAGDREGLNGSYRPLYEREGRFISCTPWNTLTTLMTALGTRATTFLLTTASQSFGAFPKLYQS